MFKELFKNKAKYLERQISQMFKHLRGLRCLFGGIRRYCLHLYNPPPLPNFHLFFFLKLLTFIKCLLRARYCVRASSCSLSYSKTYYYLPLARGRN